VAAAARDPDPGEAAPFGLGALIGEHGDRLLRPASLLCGDSAEALVQETFVQALRSAHRFPGESAVYTWLHGILLNLCRRSYRKGRRLVLDEGRVLEASVPAAPADGLGRSPYAASLARAVRARPALLVSGFACEHAEVQAPKQLQDPLLARGGGRELQGRLVIEADLRAR